VDKIKGILFAALSSSTFGLAPFFTISLIMAGYSTFEALSYRWGVASLFLFLVGVFSGIKFRMSWRDFRTVFCLSLFRATTSFSLVVAYQNIASGVASVIHFMYPLAVALTMMFVFKEPKSKTIISAIVISIIGAVFLSTGNIESSGGGDTVLGIVMSTISVFSYAGYIVGVRRTRAVNIPSVPLTCSVMGIGAVLFIIGGFFTGGIRIETDPHIWLYIAGLGLVATAISNISLVQGIKLAGPTLASIMGAMEPLTAVVIGIFVFGETFSWHTAVGIVLILFAVLLVILKQQKK
jgi:drug/metabolite transporter (DMT)-like permease